MIIKASYDKEEGLIRVPCIIKTPHKRINTDFIFDTGSSKTLLNFTDSIRLGIPRGPKSDIIRMGGKTYQGYDFSKLKIVFKTIDSKSVEFSFPIKTLKPTSPRMAELEELDHFPNILGLNFLEQGLKFFCDLKNNNIYFEKI